ncbi:hypothetical protein [Microvirga aerophila]|uniref:Uncharacterized protein n=1 Tax=Microvirga aerophila TaxID=670291 RepID=A0A512C3W2_9HYPH|nr:hypothetical protein [Microvirga aerophila]GEO18892.1 hypothetical protein MAE02_65880 [Microvirga aerophila]
MGEVIEFPQPGGTEVLHFDEKHAFGEIGDLMLSLVQEQNKEDSPLGLVMVGVPVVFIQDYHDRSRWQGRGSCHPRRGRTVAAFCVMAQPTAGKAVTAAGR